MKFGFEEVEVEEVEVEVEVEVLLQKFNFNSTSTLLQLQLNFLLTPLAKDIIQGPSGTNIGGDCGSQMADPTIYWQSKLNVAEELAKFSLFLLSVPISEAAVERSFSRQKFLETPLRNGLEDKVVQAALFVKFNFLNSLHESQLTGNG